MFAHGDDDGPGEATPDLSQLPEEQWLDALRPLSRYGRIRAQNTVGPHKVMVVGALIGELVMEEGAARSQPIRPPSLPMPGGDPAPVADPPARVPRRQVNFRLGAGEHARLVEAARLFGIRPNMLARILAVRGTDRALRDARRGE